jgi:hypothetical protein
MLSLRLSDLPALHKWVTIVNGEKHTLRRQ